jgi:hypothetical protein
MVNGKGHLRDRGNAFNFGNVIVTPSEIGPAWNFGQGGGSNDFIGITGDHNIFIPADPSLTLSAWVKPDKTTAMGVVKIGNDFLALKAAGIFLNITGAGALSAEFSGGNGNRSATGVVVQNQWQHIAIVKQPGPINTSTKLYRNGILIAAVSSSANTPNISFTGTDSIGRFDSGGTDAYKGLIGEVGVWALALTGQQILQLYSGASPLRPVERTPPRFYISIPIDTPPTPTVGKSYVKLIRQHHPADNPTKTAFPSLWRQLAYAYSPASPHAARILTDRGRYKAHQSLLGNVTFKPGSRGQCLNFPGGDADYCQGKPVRHALLKLTDDPNFTISCWARPETEFHTMGLVKWGADQITQGAASLYLNKYGESMLSIEMGDLNGFFSGALQYTAREWHHFMVMKSSGPIGTATCRMFIDGREISGTATDLDVPVPQIQSDTTTFIELGRFDRSVPKDVYRGQMGEVLIWSRTLTESEITAVSSGASPLQPRRQIPVSISFVRPGRSQAIWFP